MAIESQQNVPTVETVASFAVLFEPLDRYPAGEFRVAWRTVLFYDEHTWGDYNSLFQPDHSM